MFTDPEGYFGGVIAAAALIITKVGFDRVRGNGHVTKADLASLASAKDMREVKKDVAEVKEDVASIKGWLTGRMGEPPR